MLPQILDIPEYTIEVWDINGVFVADISKYISTSLRYNFVVNGVEEIEFAVDLVQFELLCEKIGARPINIIEPYRTDIKIRRNGEYLLGGHVIQTNVNFNSSENNKLEVKCTGYLNYFKERYMTAEYKNLTYSQIFSSLIMDSQKSYNYITNGRFEQGIIGWDKIDSAFILWGTGAGVGGSNSLYAEISTGPNTYGGARWYQNLIAGVSYTAKFTMRVSNIGGTVYIRTGGSLPSWSASISDTNWNTYTVSWAQSSNGTYFDINTTGNTNFWIDEVILNDNINNAAKRNFGVTLGVDDAAAYQVNNRIRNYDLQNVKDGCLNLTKLENDNFEHKFDANKVLNIYRRVGSDKPEVELVYPQNITSMQVSRDAQALYNSVFGLGSGIGSERIESLKIDSNSALAYKVRERTELFNSIEDQGNLDTSTAGILNIYKDMYDDIVINIDTNKIDLNDISIGDAVYVRIDGSSYVDYVNSLYRIMKMSVSVDIDSKESVSLQIRRWI